MIKAGRRRRTLLRVGMLARISRMRSRAANARPTRVPQTMRAAALDRFGGPEVLTLHLLPVPAIGARERC